MPSIINLFTGEAIKTDQQPKWENGMWFCGSMNYSDPGRNQYAAGPPAVGPIRFKLLFQITELIAIAELVKTDPVIKTFMDIIDDPRTDVIDMSLGAVQDGIGYTLSKIYAEPEQAMMRENRTMEILSGELT